MRNLITILLLTPTLALSQGNYDGYSITEDSDTTFYYRFVGEIISTFELRSILDKQSDFVFRSWAPSSLLEITRTEENIAGAITYFVIESGKKRIFVKSYKIPEQTSVKLYDYIIASDAYRLPSSNSIKNWVNGFDGITLIYETKNGNEISFKHYWTTSAQEDVPEAQILIEFNDRIEELGEFGQFAQEFAEENPFDSYMYYGTSYSIIELKNKGEKKRKNER